MNYIEDRRMRLDGSHQRLTAASQQYLHHQRERFVRLTAKLDAMSPLRVLSRGYSMATNEKGELVKSVSQVQAGDLLTVTLGDGRVKTLVQEAET
jgi:exodeoxyribonuclease VII large subunit